MRRGQAVRFALVSLPLLVLTAAGTGEGTASWTGRVTVKGNEPHAWLALTAEDGTVYEVVGEKALEIRKAWQGRRIRVEGRIVEEARGPGFPARLEATAFREVQ